MHLSRVFLGFVALCFVLIPHLSFAQLDIELIQCGKDLTPIDCQTDDGRPGYRVDECTFCDLIATAQNIIRFLVAFTVVMATLMFTYAGILYLSSAASPGNISKAHSIFWSVLVGLVITLAAWLIVDTIMKVLYGETGQFGPWNQILCEDPNALPPCRAINVAQDPASGGRVVQCNSNGHCDSGETNLNCPADCVCNANGSCDASSGESRASCPSDCGRFCFEMSVSNPAGPAPQLDMLCCDIDPSDCQARMADETAKADRTLTNACHVRADQSLPISCVFRQPPGNNANAPDDCPTCNLAAGGNMTFSGCSYTNGECWVNPVYNSKLNSFVSDLGPLAANMAITSAFDPRPRNQGGHSNICHGLGMCVDIDFTGQAGNTDNIKTVISKAESAGLKAEWEVNDDRAKNNLIRSGIPADNIRVVPGVPTHFSIYCAAGGGRDYECDGTRDD